MMIEVVKKQVYELLKNDDSGHDYKHIERVLNMSLKFAQKENVNLDIISLIALLHDVDDYKLFGKEYSNNLINAKKIMNNAKVPLEIQSIVLSELSCIGYHNRLKGIKPKTIEGMIVSDADMCDCMGITGILRIYKYTLKYNKPFFDKNIFPQDVNPDVYGNKCADTSVCHIFDKVLNLKDLMLTCEGRKEALLRYDIVIMFLYNLFREEDAPDWNNYLTNYIKLKEKI